MWWKDHFLISVAVSALYFAFTRNAIYSFLVFSSGFFIDIDHYLLYLVLDRKGFKESYSMFQKINKKEVPDYDVGKYILPFHNFELMFFLIASSLFYPIMVPVAVGALIHFSIDILYVRNFKVKHYYSVIYYMISKQVFRCLFLGPFM